jgi:hypothetical protein
METTDSMPIDVNDINFDEIGIMSSEFKPNSSAPISNTLLSKIGREEANLAATQKLPSQ